jgi:hypothetical protein
MDTKYFYVKDNKPVGPLTIEDLLEKDVSTKTYVWTKGMEQWAMLESIPELFKALQLKKENPPRFQRENTIEYKEENPPHFQNEVTIQQKEESQTQYKKENPPLSKKEKRNQILNSILLVIVLIAGLCLTAFAFFGYDEGYGVPPIGLSIIFGYVLIWYFSFVLTENLGLEKLFKKIGNVLFWIFLVGGVILTVISFVLDISFIFYGSVIPDYFPGFTGLYYLCWLIALFIFITDFLYKKFDIFSSEDSYFEFCFYFFVFILFMRGVFISIWLIFNDYNYNQLSSPSKKFYEGWGVVVLLVIFLFFIIFIFQNLSKIFTFFGRMLPFVIAIILIVVVFILIFGAILSFFGINI